MKNLIISGLLSLLSMSAYADQLMLAVQGSGNLTDCSKGQCNTVVVRSLNPHVKQGDTFNLECTMTTIASQMLEMPGDVKFAIDPNTTLITSGPGVGAETTLLPTTGHFSEEFAWTGKATKDNGEVLLSFDSPAELTGNQIIHVTCENK